MKDLNIQRPQYNYSAKVTGGKFVWVKNAHREVLVNGIKLLNPPKYGEILYAGDAVISALKGYDINGISFDENVGFVIKGYKLAKAITNSDTKVYVLCDDRSHVPVAGNKIGTAIIGAVTKDVITVGSETKEVYCFEITAGALGTKTAGEILYDTTNMPSEFQGEDANTMLCSDIYNGYDPSKGYDVTSQKAEVFIECKAYENRLSYAATSKLMDSDNVKRIVPGIVKLG